MQLPFTYTGEQVDPESGLVYLCNRYLDPATGRFLTPDPLGFAGSGVNLYAYVGNNPATLTDPSGLACFLCNELPGPGGGGGGESIEPPVEPPVLPPAPAGGYPEGFIGPVPQEPIYGPFPPGVAPAGAGAFSPAGEGGTFCPETEGPGAGENNAG